MNSAVVLAASRRRASLTQRELARRTGLAQSAVARLESGRITPRADTLDRLLHACGRRLESVPLEGVGIDRSAIRALLRLSPGERFKIAVREARNVDRLSGAVRR